MTDHKNRLAFATRTIHAGQHHDPSTGAVMVPIYATSTYAQGKPRRSQGLRIFAQPEPDAHGVRALHRRSESGSDGFAFASGLAAISTILELLDAGAHVVASDDLYGGSFRLFRQGAPAHRRSHLLAGGHDEPRRGRSGDYARDEADLGRDADQSAAQARRSRGPRGHREEAQAAHCSRQHLRQPLCPASAGAGHRHRRPLHDQIPQRPFRYRRRLRGDGQRRSRRPPEIPPERHRRHRRPVSIPSWPCAASRRSRCG